MNNKNIHDLEIDLYSRWKHNKSGEVCAVIEIRSNGDLVLDLGKGATTVRTAGQLHALYTETDETASDKTVKPKAAEKAKASPPDAFAVCARLPRQREFIRRTRRKPAKE